MAFQGLLLQPSDDQLYLPSLKVDERLPGVSLTSTTRTCTGVIPLNRTSLP